MTRGVIESSLQEISGEEATANVKKRVDLREDRGAFSFFLLLATGNLIDRLHSILGALAPTDL